MNTLRLFRHGSGSTRRLQARRRPIVENLEGRQLLSVGHPFGSATAIMVPQIHSVADVQKVREFASATGKHLDLGTRVAPYNRHAEAVATRIGSAMIVGSHGPYNF
jgi:hypothetical protein